MRSSKARLAAEPMLIIIHTRLVNVVSVRCSVSGKVSVQKTSVKKVFDVSNGTSSIQGNFVRSLRHILDRSADGSRRAGKEC